MPRPSPGRSGVARRAPNGGYPNGRYPEPQHTDFHARLGRAMELLEDALDPDDECSSVAALEALITPRRDPAHLSDLVDSQREAIDMAGTTRDYVDGTVEAYRMRRDERSERGIRRLTVLAGVLGPLALISGIYGANFARIPGSGSPYGFWVFVGARLAFLAAALWYLWRRGLL